MKRGTGNAECGNALFGVHASACSGNTLKGGHQARFQRNVGFPLFLMTLFLICFAQSAFAQRGAVRFGMVDVFVDSKEQPLAAYQLEVAVERGHARVVGIEGGEPGAFNQPPFYDPKAIQHDHVILAAFNASAQSALPKGRTRVASIHMEITGSESPEFVVKLTTAGNANGKKIKATATLEQRNTK